MSAVALVAGANSSGSLWNVRLQSALADAG